MLSLKIDLNGGTAPLADPADPAVTVWYDSDGRLAAYGHTAESDHWLHLPDLVSFRFGPASPEITAVPLPSASEARVVDAYRRLALPIALQALGHEVLHASAVLTSRGVVALGAVSTVGKSTVAYALSDRGHSLWADDAVAFDVCRGVATVLPLPFEIRLRPASRAYFAERAKVRRPGEANGRGGLSSRPAPLAAIFALERLPSRTSIPPIELRRLTPGDGFRAVLPHAYCFNFRDTERRRRMIRDYLQLADRVPIFTLRFADGLDNLPALVERIEGALDALTVRSP